MDYVEDLIYLGHGEVLFYFDDEEIDHLLIRLQKIDGVLTLTYQYFCLLCGKEFGVFFMDNGEMSELKRRVDKGQVVRVVMWQSFI